MLWVFELVYKEVAVQAFSSICRGMMEQILLAYSFFLSNFTSIMMVYKKNPKEIVLFDILAGVLQGDTFTPYVFILCLD